MDNSNEKEKETIIPSEIMFPKDTIEPNSI